MNITRYLSILPLVALLCACTSVDGVSTNLDKENFTNYYAASKVKMYDSEKSFPGQYHALGLVEGESCQLKANEAPANDIDARTDARKKAAAKQANAIVFTACVAIEDQQCLSLQVCYGKAYQLVADN